MGVGLSTLFTIAVIAAILALCKDGGLYKYTIGNKIDIQSASALQSELRKKGFSDAFVVAFKNGKRIPVREALRR